MRRSLISITLARWLLLAVGCLGTGVALFVAVENWRGDHAWKIVQHELEARGERLDFAALQPAPVADEQNFLKAPMLARLVYERADDPERTRMLKETRLMDFLPIVFRGPGDFTALRDAMKRTSLLNQPASDSPAGDILQAMRPLQPLLDDVLEAAQRRPKAAFERRTNPLESPRFGADAVFRLGQVLHVRALAEIELRRIDDAYADLIALQRLGDALSANPINLLALLVGDAQQGLAADAILEGCRRHVWTDSQLADFQKLFERSHPLAGFRAALRLERAGFVQIMDHRPSIKVFGDFPWPFWLFHGWAQQNKVTFCRQLDADVLSRISLDPDRIAPHIKPAMPQSRSPAPRIFSAYSAFSQMALSNVDRILDSLGHTVDQQQLNSVAWALERFRLAHGQAPRTLDDLVPAFLPAVPHGVFDAQPFRYVPRPDGTYQLYSLGMNGRDDGGADDDTLLPADRRG